MPTISTLHRFYNRSGKLAHNVERISVDRRIAKHFAETNVRFGSLADIEGRLRDVRFAPKSGPQAEFFSRVLSCGLDASRSRKRIHG